MNGASYQNERRVLEGELCYMSASVCSRIIEVASSIL